MGELMVVALQSRLTNVATFMVGPERWDTPFLYDDVQVGLQTYLAGMENWRYRGSLAIHRILSPDGIKTVYESEIPVMRKLRRADAALLTPATASVN